MNEPYLTLKQRIENIRKKLTDIKDMLEKAENSTKFPQKKVELIS